MATTYQLSSFNQIIYDILDEISDNEITEKVTDESIKGYILQACQRIAERLPIRQKTDLRLVLGQTQYNFADTDTPVTGTGTVNTGANKTVTGVTATGTGTITTSDTDVTGTGTAFLTELAVGKMIIVGTEKKTVTSITSNTVCEIDDGFDTDLSASAFNYSTTMFTKEINVGSTIISNSVSRVVESITDAYNLTVTAAYTAAQTAQSFTVDTKVTEIPTKFYQIEKIDRLEDTVSRPVEIVSNEDLIRYRQQDWGASGYSNYYKPYWASVWNNSTTRYLEIYPEVDTDKQITLYGFIQINPRSYESLALTANIPLTQEYEPAIREFCKYRIYKRAKQKEDSAEAYNLFGEAVRSMLVNLPVTKRIQITKR